MGTGAHRVNIVELDDSTQNEANTIQELRIPDHGNINTLISKLVAHFLSNDDTPDNVDAHKETYNAAPDHVEDLLRRHRDRHEQQMMRAANNGLDQETTLEDGAVQALEEVLGEIESEPDSASHQINGEPQ